MVGVHCLYAVVRGAAPESAVLSVSSTMVELTSWEQSRLLGPGLFPVSAGSGAKC